MYNTNNIYVKYIVYWEIETHSDICDLVSPHFKQSTGGDRQDGTCKKNKKELI